MDLQAICMKIALGHQSLSMVKHMRNALISILSISCLSLSPPLSLYRYLSPSPFPPSLPRSLPFNLVLCTGKSFRRSWRCCSRYLPASPTAATRTSPATTPMALLIQSVFQLVTTLAQPPQPVSTTRPTGLWMALPSRPPLLHDSRLQRLRQQTTT